MRSRKSKPPCGCKGCSHGGDHVPLTKRQRRLVERWFDGDLNPDAKSFDRDAAAAERLILHHAEARAMAEEWARRHAEPDVQEHRESGSVRTKACVVFVDSMDHIDLAHRAIHRTFSEWAAEGYL